MIATPRGRMKGTGARRAACRIGGGMGRDDWMYDEDVWEEGEEEAEKRPSPEVQCPNCQHWVPREAPYCSWCMKPVVPKKK
jgi:hypothetical protein